MHRSLLPLAAVFLAVAGCTATKPSAPGDYFARGSESLSEGSYTDAIEHYRTLLDEHPFSEYSEEAELKIGIAQYKSGSCPEATAALTDFQRRYPTSPYLPEVGYLLGKCAEEQMRPPDRDQSATQNAHAYYQALVQQFPSSPFAELAREQLAWCRESLAEHELLIAEFYTHQERRKAAEIRYLDLVNRFNDTDVAGQALLQLGNLYRREQEPDKAILAFAAVEYYHPDNAAARNAGRQLSKLLDGEPPPRGDPLAVLKAETGRTRTIALAQSPKHLQTQKKPPSGSASSPMGFGMPSGGSGPFGQSGGGLGGGRF